MPENVGRQPDHILDEIFEGGGALRLERRFHRDSHVDVAFVKAAKAYDAQAERLKQPGWVGSSAAQAARDAFLEALSCQVRVD